MVDNISQILADNFNHGMSRDHTLCFKVLVSIDEAEGLHIV